MNYTNMNLAIKLMQYVGKIEKQMHKRILDMGTYQDSIGNKKVKSKLTPVKAAHCGTVCCFSGWVAQCPAFQKQGVTMDSSGAAVYKGEYCSSAIAELLDIPPYEALDLVYWEYDRRVKPSDVVRKLKGLKAEYGN